VSRLPIRLRLTLAFALAMAIVLAGMGTFVYRRVGDSLLASVDTTLSSQADEAALDVRRGDVRDLDVTGGTTLAQVVDSRGRVLHSVPPGLAPLLPPADVRLASSGGRVRRSISLHSPRGDWRVLAIPNGPSDQVVLVARSLEPREDSLDRLLRQLIVATPLALLLASLAGYALAAAALRPVEAMRRRAAAVSAVSPGRLPVPPSGDEISRLATTLNEMLARLEAAFEHERRFVADASHELRTPLALLRAEIEVALRRPRSAAELETTLRSAGEETERLSRLAEDLMLMARADRGPLPLRRETVAAESVFAAVAGRFAAAGGEAVGSIHVEETDALVEADADRLVQAVANLVDNSLAHGAGPVVLFAVERPDTVELHVADSGEGFDDEFLPRAFDRFSRADEARGRGGTGLGLSIVELIAAAHGGRAGAANRPEGGADVWVAIPRPPVRVTVRESPSRSPVP
jgi:two-component system OmpR family sensor kinase